MADEQGKTIDFTVDHGNLYREETYTDLRVGAIRRMIPVKADGSPDKSRKTIFMGQTNLMTQYGSLPIQNMIEAKELQQAIKKYPEAMKQALDRMMEEMEKMREREASRIVVPEKEESRIILPGR